MTLTGEGFETFDNSAASARCRVVGDDSAWCEYYDEPLLQVRTRARCLGVVTDLSASSLVCIVPPVPNDDGAPGVATLQLALNGVDFTTLETVADSHL